MIPKRKTPKSGQNAPSKPNTETASISRPKNQSNASNPSIVELLQNQIDEDRKKARSKNQIKARQNLSSSSQSRQILQKKKNMHNNPSNNISSTDSQNHPVKPQLNQEVASLQSQYSTTEPTPKNEIIKTQKVQMATEAVGSDDTQPPKKLEPTGFTYFDKLNEKDIFLDPLKYF